jgi:hypothetical protein
MSQLLWLSLCTSFIVKPAQNAVGCTGCKILAKLDLQKLIFLELSKDYPLKSDDCKVGNEGLIQLSKAKFAAKFNINLSKHKRNKKIII